MRHFYSFIIFFLPLHRTHSLLRVRKTESYFLNLPSHHQKLLSKYKEHLQEIKRCIENNDQIIKLIIKDVAHIFENVCPSTAQVDSVRDIYLSYYILTISASYILQSDYPIKFYQYYLHHNQHLETLDLLIIFLCYLNLLVMFHAYFHSVPLKYILVYDCRY